MKRIAYLVFFLVWFYSCNTKQQTTTIVPVDSVVMTKADSNLVTAQQNFAQDSSEENYIWLGRRLGYLSRFDEAFEVYTQGIAKYPQSFALYRHRGHRYISKRQFDLAADDLSKASQLMKGKPLEIEPDGIPNKLNKPLSTVQFNVWYHLGLAHYLMGDFKKAEIAYLECMTVSNNDDLLVATSDWLYMTYRRMQNEKAAKQILSKIPDTMEIIENDSYFKRLKMYQGKVPADSLLQVDVNRSDADLSLATQGYGVGNWYLYNGDTAKAKDIFERVLKGKSKSSFGFIAAEVDLTRLK
jgi:tetratricopeptide (TPR) repeat protein